MTLCAFGLSFFSFVVQFWNLTTKVGKENHEAHQGFLENLTF